MRYSRPHVRQALAAAREAGKPVDGLSPDDRESIVQLERWGYLPVDQDLVDARIASWYVRNGLATRDGDDPQPVATPVDTPRDTRDDAPGDTRGDTPAGSTIAALIAAEAAIEAARAALAAARAMGGSAA